MKNEVRVDPSALYAEAQNWDNAQHEISTAATTSAGQEMSVVQAGIFQIVLAAYQSLQSNVAARTWEGVEATGKVADGLRRVARDAQSTDQLASESIISASQGLA